MYKLIQGDCISVVKTLPPESVNCVITSPPYWGLRDYKVDGQFGLEPTPDLYVQHLVDLFREIKRVLKDDGTVWLNLGDSYIGGKGRSGSKGADLQEERYDKGNTLNRGYQTIGEHGITKVTDDRKMLKEFGIKPKDLVGIPWRVAFALQEDGWYLRSDIIWAKRNCMPESVKDRPTRSHEYIFLLTKSAKYYYDYQAVLEPAAYDGRKDTMFKGAVKDYEGIVPNGKPQTFATEGHERWQKDENGLQVRNKRDVWWVSTKPFKDAHFATFPEDLIEPCVLAGCPKGGVILDPFNGAGTTGVVALKHGRDYIGIELNESYIEMSRERIEKATQQEKLL
jgi:DNA modification methylase